MAVVLDASVIRARGELLNAMSVCWWYQVLHLPYGLPFFPSVHINFGLVSWELRVSTYAGSTEELTFHSCVHSWLCWLPIWHQPWDVTMVNPLRESLKCASIAKLEGNLGSGLTFTFLYFTGCKRSIFLGRNILIQSSSEFPPFISWESHSPWPYMIFFEIEVTCFRWFNGPVLHAYIRKYLCNIVQILIPIDPTYVNYHHTSAHIFTQVLNNIWTHKPL